jgi:hypothetical protein
VERGSRPAWSAWSGMFEAICEGGSREESPRDGPPENRFGCGGRRGRERKHAAATALSDEILAASGVIVWGMTDPFRYFIGFVGAAPHTTRLH